MIINHKDAYSKWIQEQGKNSSYKRSIEILSKTLQKNLFTIDDPKYLEQLYKDLLDQQKDDDSKYFHAEAPSYGKDGFYSASIKSYITFLKDIKNLTVSYSLIKKESNNLHNRRLNQILYGPPGTGKTYNTINEALQIIDGDVPQNRLDAKERFEELSDAGQIEFVTFHQSYGYEEFIEGIKANSIDGNISYDVENGF